MRDQKRFPFRYMLIAGLVFTVPLCESLAQDGAALDARPGGEAERAKWFSFYNDEAASYQFAIAGDPSTPLALHPVSILNYTNPVRASEQHGSVYLWSLEGRPQVIGSIWSSVPKQSPDQRSVTHEFHSLSTGQVTSSHARRIGRRGVVPDWATSIGGVQYKTVPDAPRPPETEAARLVQMRQLSRRFAASIVETEDEVDRRLRLQTSPAFRYESKPAGVLDGAIFLFVMGTDPEAVLLIEALEADGAAKWQYAVARFTNSPLRVSYRDKPVWECPPATPYIGTEPYFLYWGVSMQNAIP